MYDIRVFRYDSYISGTLELKERVSPSKLYNMSKPRDEVIENTNGIAAEKGQAIHQREREGSESDTIIPDGSGTVKHSSGMTVDTHYAAQLKPSKLTGRGLTFMVCQFLFGRIKD